MCINILSFINQGQTRNESKNSGEKQIEKQEENEANQKYTSPVGT